MESREDIELGESVEMCEMANGVVENAHPASTSAIEEDNPRPRTRTLTVTLRSEVTRPFPRSRRRDFESIISVAEVCDNVDSSHGHGPSQSLAPANTQGEKGIKIENLDRVFSSFLFASNEQKQMLKDIANMPEHDEDEDGELSREEFEKMKDYLKQNHPDLHKIFVAVPERYTQVPVFILSTALLIVCVAAFHKIHYSNHHPTEHYPSCSILIFDVDRMERVWSFLSYAYAHKNIRHWEAIQSKNY